MMYLIRFLLGFAITMILGIVLHEIYPSALSGPMLVGVSIGVGIGQVFNELLDKRKQF